MLHEELSLSVRLQVGGVLSIAFSVFGLFSSTGAADDNLQVDERVSAFDDCTNIEINYQTDGQFTREERLSSMDEKFFESLSRFEACQHSTAVSGGGGGGGGGGAASPNMSGADSSAGKDSQPKKENADSLATANKDSQTAVVDASGQPDPNSVSLGSGKLPDDIPPVDNDSILEAQIRSAAERETDPKIKKKLWDEYRKYKGLPRSLDNGVDQ